MASTSAPLARNFFFVCRLERKAEFVQLADVSVIVLDVLVRIKLLHQSTAEYGEIRAHPGWKWTFCPAYVAPFDGYGNFIPKSSPIELVGIPLFQKSRRLVHTEVDAVNGHTAMNVVPIMAVAVF